jgi:hypothetical protein
LKKSGKKTVLSLQIAHLSSLIADCWWLPLSDSVLLRAEDAQNLRVRALTSRLVLNAQARLAVGSPIHHHVSRKRFPEA